MKNRLLTYVMILAAATMACAPKHSTLADTPAQLTNPPTEVPFTSFVMPWNDASTGTVIDASTLNPTALSHITVCGSHFCDASGNRKRFLGVNMAHYANFPSNTGQEGATEADQIAAHLHKLGVNIVRLQALDNLVSNGGFIPAAANKLPQTDAQFDPAKLQLFDYFVYALKTHGIYVDLELHVGWKFTAQDGVITPQYSNSPALPWFDSTMMNLEKQYAKALLQHINYKTGIALANDPVLAMVEIDNEDSLIYHAYNQDVLDDIDITANKQYEHQLQLHWNNFLTTHYPAQDGKTADQVLADAWNVPGGIQGSLANYDVKLFQSDFTTQPPTQSRKDYFQFLRETEQNYSSIMRTALHNDGVTCPVNCSIVGRLMNGLWRENASDFADEHGYWDPAKFPNGESLTNWYIYNTAMVANDKDYSKLFDGLAALTRSRIADKPFVVSEFGDGAPNEFGAETLPMLASYAAWQDWDAIFLFCYQWDENKNQVSYFDHWYASEHNPGKLGFLPAAARIFLGDPDQRASVPTTELQLPNTPAYLDNLFATDTKDWPTYLYSLVNLWRKGLADNANVDPSTIPDATVVSTLVNNSPVQTQFTGSVTEPRLVSVTNSPSSNNTIIKQWYSDSGTVQTGTYIVGALGWAVAVIKDKTPSQGTVQAGNLYVTPTDNTRPFGVYTLTSMDGKATLSTTNQMLLTACGDVENVPDANGNNGMVWGTTAVTDKNGHTTYYPKVTNWGSYESGIEPLKATIKITPVNPTFNRVTVYRLNSTGGGESNILTAAPIAGTVTFPINPADNTMWYYIKMWTQ